ncbi:DUF2975 domain-containing protein [Ruminococcus flavefaciens]|uniref:DUF2975 domain-containing protein n=1 Tax=Ruminococcus flavefaciens TaxID=1265 RepID=UPI00048C5718|nr:DUF2975 domain-containing protein [Ruminococcus flavefaciens]
MNKTKVEAMIKRSSLIVMIIAAIETVLSLLMAVMEYKNSKKMSPEVFKMMLPNSVNMLFNASTFIIEMVVFYRIFRSGRPFTNGNITAVRVIAALSLIGSIVIALIRHSAGMPFISALSTSIFSVFGAVVFLFFAEIMRYGKLLQIESDETL